MSVVKSKRGRPPKRRARRIADSVNEFCAKTGQSRATVFRHMARGLIRYIQVAPGFPRQIPHSEYQRLGYGPVTDEV
jgi:hypothetical protein